MQEFFGKVKTLDKSFKPKYMTLVLEKVYNAAVAELLNKRMTDPFV